MTVVTKDNIKLADIKKMFGFLHDDVERIEKVMGKFEKECRGEKSIKYADSIKYMAEIYAFLAYWRIHSEQYYNVLNSVSTLNAHKTVARKPTVRKSVRHS